MGKITIMLIFAKLLSKSLGFFRDIILSYYYGASDISDAYLVCITIPVVIFAFIGTGLSDSFIPIYSKVYENDGRKEANKFTSNLANLALIICTFIIILCLIFTKTIVKTFASGFSEDLLRITVSMTRISIWAIYFSTIAYIGQSYLHIKNKYLTPALTGLALNTMVIFGIVLGAKFDDRILSLGYVSGVAIQSLIIIIAMKKIRFKYTFIINYKDPNIKALFYLTIPLILGISADQINVLVDRTISSRIIEGGISSLVYANRLILFVHTLFVTSISAVIYPQLTKLVLENKIEEHSELFKKSLTYVSLVLLPLTIGTLIFSKTIIKFLYGRGAFDNQAIIITSGALFFYSLGIIGTGFRGILLKVFYSYGDTKTPTKNAAISVGLNIILNIILSRYMGISGLALATSISSTFCVVLLFISLRKKIGHFGFKALTISFIKIFLASLLTGVAAKLLYLIFLYYLNQNLAFITAIVFSALFYLIVIYFMKIKGLNELIIIYGRKILKLIIRSK